MTVGGHGLAGRHCRSTARDRLDPARREWAGRPQASDGRQLTTVTGTEDRSTSRLATDPITASYSSESPRWPT